MGVDTVKLSYDLRPVQYSGDGGAAWLFRHGWEHTKRYGSSGPVHWHEWKHSGEGLKIITKGVTSATSMLWEGSLPKAMGIVGPADPDCVQLLDRWIRRAVPNIGNPAIRRIDLTHDVYDPEGAWRKAAVGWNPHARSRYVQAVYQDGETVWQHNKSRGVRVYDKFEESGEPWAIGQTRVEYQVRHGWPEKLGLGKIHSRFAEYCDAALNPIVSDLCGRVQK